MKLSKFLLVLLVLFSIVIVFAQASQKSKATVETPNQVTLTDGVPAEALSEHLSKLVELSQQVAAAHNAEYQVENNKAKAEEQKLKEEIARLSDALGLLTDLDQQSEKLN